MIFEKMNVDQMQTSQFIDDYKDNMNATELQNDIYEEENLKIKLRNEINQKKDLIQ
jgi:hypothetical protein